MIEPSEDSNEFDAFISYDKSIHDKILSFTLILKDHLSIKISVDSPQIDMSMEKEYKKVVRNLFHSKFVICCMNKEYTQSSKSKDELMVAYASSKPILVIFFDDIPPEDLICFKFWTNDFEKAVSIVHMLQLLKDNWYENFMTETKRLVEMILGRKTSINNFNCSEDEVFKSLFDDDLSNRLLSNQNSNSKNEDTESSIIACDKTVTKKDDEIYEKVFLNPNIIELSNNSSLVQFAFGFNRIVWLECRERFLITSSYFKSVISVDKMGKWIEMRNPGGIMKLPFAICLDSCNNIYIGDNKLKFILVFDKYFKYLRTICEKISNGFHDMVIFEDKKKILYATDLYSGIVMSIDIEKNVIINSIEINAPTFISLLSHSIIVLTSNDVIYAINDKTFKIRFKFEINRAVSFSSLCTFRDQSIVLLMCYEVLVDGSKSKNVNMCLIKVDSNKGVFTRRILVDIDQVNDMVLTKNSMCCINDTNVAIFSFKDTGGLLKWTQS